MKSRYFYLLIFFTVSAVFYFTGCPMRVGKCTYGESPDQRGSVVIKSIDKIYIDKELNYRIKVEGFFTRDFIYSKDDFLKKFSSRGYKKGSELEGVIKSGGPCPPMYNISD